MNKAFVKQAALWVAIAVALVMATLPKPPHLYIDKYGDKFEHMLAFAVIALLAALAYPKARLTRIAERLSFMGALIEVVQAMPIVHRDCDIRDWIADTLAVIVMLTIVALVRGSQSSRR